MTRILDMIHEWRETLCNELMWEVGLGNIKDMHRLLEFKGQNVQSSTAGTADIKSLEELEEEDGAAQSAYSDRKLEKCRSSFEGERLGIRRACIGSRSLFRVPPEPKPNYKKHTLHELEKLQAKSFFSTNYSTILMLREEKGLPRETLIM
ncbi:hypothetical protein FRC12_001337 [Ceratobasidium sp. 428]|nr:hypothetical protein FRC12_001337 [Ceratobasidium sp. 428]